LHALRGIHERNVGLHLNVLSHHNLFLLEWVSTSSSSPPRSSSTTKRIEKILKVEVRAEAACSCTTESTTKRRSTTEWVPAAESTRSARSTSTALVESRRAVLIVLRLLRRVRQDFVRGLRLAELLLGLRVLVRVGVVLFRESVVRLLDLGRRGRLTNTQSLVRVFHGQRDRRGVEGAAL
jgi:hypothetical protein